MVHYLSFSWNSNFIPTNNKVVRIRENPVSYGDTYVVLFLYYKYLKSKYSVFIINFIYILLISTFSETFIIIGRMLCFIFNHVSWLIIYISFLFLSEQFPATVLVGKRFNTIVQKTICGYNSYQEFSALVLLNF